MPHCWGAGLELAPQLGSAWAGGNVLMSSLSPWTEGILGSMLRLAMPSHAVPYNAMQSCATQSQSPQPRSPVNNWELHKHVWHFPSPKGDP